MTTQEESAK